MFSIGFQFPILSNLLIHVFFTLPRFCSQVLECSLVGGLGSLFLYIETLAFIAKSWSWSRYIKFCLRNLQPAFKFIFTSSALKSLTYPQSTIPAHMIIPSSSSEAILDSCLSITFVKSNFMYIFGALETAYPIFLCIFLIFLFITTVYFWTASNLVSLTAIEFQ